MATVLPAYLKIVEALTPIMQGLPGMIVTIDGRDGVGKTTLGRYLAWHFNVTLIETDLFLIPAQDYPYPSRRSDKSHHRTPNYIASSDNR